MRHPWFVKDMPPQLAHINSYLLHAKVRAMILAPYIIATSSGGEMTTSACCGTTNGCLRSCVCLEPGQVSCLTYASGVLHCCAEADDAMRASLIPTCTLTRDRRRSTGSAASPCASWSSWCSRRPSNRRTSTRAPRSSRCRRRSSSDACRLRRTHRSGSAAQHRLHRVLSSSSGSDSDAAVSVMQPGRELQDDESAAVHDRTVASRAAAVSSRGIAAPATVHAPVV